MSGRLAAAWDRVVHRGPHEAAEPVTPAVPRSHVPECSESAVRPVERLVDRRHATVEGVVSATRATPECSNPRFIATVDDGTGSIDLVWLGRRAIGGVDEGIRVRAHGLACVDAGGALIHNPRYEILPEPAERTR